MKTIRIGLGTCGVSAGGEKTYEAVKHEIEKRNIQVIVKETGCNGMCYREPLLEVIDESQKSFMYGEVTPDKAIRIIDEHVLNGTPVSEWVVQGEAPSDDDPRGRNSSWAAPRSASCVPTAIWSPGGTA